MDLLGVAPGDQWETIVSVAQRLETGGFESAWLYDHFHTVPEATLEPTWECWSTMAGLAATTDSVRLGQMCTCNGYRPPAYLAKVAATVDAMSGGRVELGIGAGWYEEEFEAYGYEFPKPSVRIGQLRDAVEIIKRMWTEDRASYDGTYFSINEAINQPRPAQEPHPPLWIAGGGEQLTLRLVAEHANWANFEVDHETFERKRNVLYEHCQQVGRDPGDIGLSLHKEIVVGDDQLERVAEQRGRDPETYRRRALVGEPEHIVEELGRYGELGCSYVICYFPDAAWGDSIERFAAEVIPRLGEPAQ